MLPEGYEYSRSANLTQYEFYSRGPKGNIRKLISYSYIGTWDGHNFFNLGFGDYDQSGNQVLDLVITDNKDAYKVLATVAATAVDFFKHQPNCGVIFEGSTSARTRLYQIKIAEHYHEISKTFDIQGLTEDGKWENFAKGMRYKGFFVKKK